MRILIEKPGQIYMVDGTNATLRCAA